VIVSYEASDVIENVFANFMYVVTYMHKILDLKYMGLNGINLKNSSKNQKRGTYQEID